MTESVRFALLVAYDGEAFHGSQLQPQRRTVQGVLEQALGELLKKPTRLHLASRTDAGVHAREQVCAFTSSSMTLGLATIVAALNSRLPVDVKLRRAVVVEESFNPRHAALWREYTYSLSNSATPPVLERRLQLHIRAPLDDAAMQPCLADLVGSHDFAAFCGPAVPPDASTVRRMLSASLDRTGDTLVFRLRANAFLHQQVRRTVNALVAVGRGKLSGDEFADLLNEGVPRGAWTQVSAPHPLVLERIKFPPKYGLG